MLEQLSNEILLKVLRRCKNRKTLEEISKLNQFYKHFIEKFDLIRTHPQHVNIGISTSKVRWNVLHYPDKKRKSESKLEHFERDELPSDDGDLIYHMFKKYRTIGYLGVSGLNKSHTIVLSSNFVKKWLTLLIYVNSFKISNARFECSQKEFIQFCKSFNEFILNNSTTAGHICDEVLCEIVTSTTLEISLDSDNREIELQLSDDTLEAMIAGHIPKKFILTRAKTQFTVKGIKKMVENLLKLKRKNTHLDLGVLPADQKTDAENWRNINSEGLGYSITYNGPYYGEDYKVSSLVNDAFENASVYDVYSGAGEPMQHRWEVNFSILRQGERARQHLAEGAMPRMRPVEGGNRHLDRMRLEWARRI